MARLCLTFLDGVKTPDHSRPQFFLWAGCPGAVCAVAHGGGRRDVARSPRGGWPVGDCGQCGFLSSCKHTVYIYRCYAIRSGACNAVVIATSTHSAHGPLAPLGVGARAPPGAMLRAQCAWACPHLPTCWRHAPNGGGHAHNRPQHAGVAPGCVVMPTTAHGLTRLDAWPDAPGRMA